MAADRDGFGAKSPAGIPGSAPEIHFLFRFRDLIAPSIEEHKKIIAAKDWCWWGWWKRPTEGSRDDIWKAFDEEIKTYGKVQVGLVDSGTGNVYCALADGVIKPDEALEAGHSEHVPAYYRDSSASRAWIKIVDIHKKPIDFFGNYSFTEAPRLRNYTGPTLDRFKNKKIVNVEELKGMETTIWQVRPAKPSDDSRQILLSINELTDPVAVDVVSCAENTILHLTDVHFAIGPNREKHVWRLESETDAPRHTMVQAIKAALHGRKVGFVVISGDFTFVGSPEEFHEAQAAISYLLSDLELSTDHLMIVPGNHDIRWTTDKIYKPGAKIRQAPQEAKHNYKEFYRNLLRHEPNDHLSMGRRLALPSGLMVEMCGVNSSSLELGKDFLAAMGRIDEGSLDDAANVLGWASERTRALRVLVIHHHLAVTEDLEPAEGYGRGYGLAIDAVGVQRRAAKRGVHLVLHGHKHRCFIWRSTVYELPEWNRPQYRLGQLSIVGGGSAGSVETHAASNYFNLFTVRHDSLGLEMFRSEQVRGFELFHTLKADLTVARDGRGLELGEWVSVPKGDAA
ncbi:MAG TPA: metallophosphoesterase [Xanthobacteraceae bacterium]